MQPPRASEGLVRGEDQQRGTMVPTKRSRNCMETAEASTSISRSPSRGKKRARPVVSMSRAGQHQQQGFTTEQAPAEAVSLAEARVVGAEEEKEEVPVETEEEEEGAWPYRPGEYSLLVPTRTHGRQSGHGNDMYVVLKKSLGSGGFGSVCAGFKISSYYREAEGQSTVKGREVAIKRQPARHHCHGDLTRRAPLITVPVAAEQVSLPVSTLAKNEITALRCLQGHSNIVRLFDTFVMEPVGYGATEVLMVMERCQMDVHTAITTFVVTEDHMRSWLYQTLAALDYAHRIVGITHRDIKPENLLLTAELQVKVADWGLCTQRGLVAGGLTVGTLDYTSPEVLSNQAYDHKTDLWSTGVTFLSLCLHTNPFQTSPKGSKEERKVQGLLKQARFCGLPPATTTDTTTPRVSAIHAALKGQEEYKTSEGFVSVKFGRSCRHRETPLRSKPVIAVLRQLLAMDPEQRPTAQALMTYSPLFHQHDDTSHPLLPFVTDASKLAPLKPRTPEDPLGMQPRLEPELFDSSSSSSSPSSPQDDPSSRSQGKPGLSEDLATGLRSPSAIKESPSAAYPYSDFALEFDTITDGQAQQQQQPTQPPEEEASQPVSLRPAQSHGNEHGQAGRGSVQTEELPASPWLRGGRYPAASRAGREEAAAAAPTGAGQGLREGGRSSRAAAAVRATAPSYSGSPALRGTAGKRVRKVDSDDWSTLVTARDMAKRRWEGEAATASATGVSRGGPTGGEAADGSSRPVEEEEEGSQRGAKRVKREHGEVMDAMLGDGALLLPPPLALAPPAAAAAAPPGQHGLHPAGGPPSSSYHYSMARQQPLRSMQDWSSTRPAAFQTEHGGAVGLQWQAAAAAAAKSLPTAMGLMLGSSSKAQQSRDAWDGHRTPTGPAAYGAITGPFTYATPATPPTQPHHYDDDDEFADL